MDFLESIYNWLVEFFSPNGFIDSFFQFLSYYFLAFFNGVLDFLYNFIFEDLFGYCSYYGQNILNFFFDKFASSPVGIGFLPFFVGLIFLMFILKRIFQVLR